MHYSGDINLLEKLTSIAFNNNKEFSLVSNTYSYNGPNNTVYNHFEYTIKIGEMSFTMSDLSTHSLFNALVFFTAKIEYRAEVVDF